MAEPKCEKIAPDEKSWISHFAQQLLSVNISDWHCPGHKGPQRGDPFRSPGESLVQGIADPGSQFSPSAVVEITTGARARPLEGCML